MKMLFEIEAKGITVVHDSMHSICALNLLTYVYKDQFLVKTFFS